MRPSGALTFLAVAAILFGLGPFRTPDVWWHLAAGEWMLRTGEIPPRADPFGAATDGAVWLDHSWLTQLLFAGANRIGGLQALGGLQVLSIFGAMGCVWATIRRRHPTAPIWLPTLFAALYLPAQWFHLTPRPLLLTHLFFALFVYLTRARRLTLVCAVILIVWANCHAAFVAGLLYLALWAAGEQIDHLAAHKRDLKAIFHTRFSSITALALACLSPLANPYGYRLFLYPLRVSGLTGPGQPREWAPPDFHPLLWVFWILLGLAMFALFFRSTRPKFEALLPMAGFAALALHARRHVEFFNILALSSLADSLAAALAGMTRQRARRAAGIAAGLLMGAIPALPLACFSLGLWPNPFATAETLFPRAALDYLLARKTPSRLFNSHSLGGYISWRAMEAGAPGPVGLATLERAVDRLASPGGALRNDRATTSTRDGTLAPDDSALELPPRSRPADSPLLRPFIDGRTDLYSPALVGDYFTILRGSDGKEVERLLALYHLDAILLVNPEGAGIPSAFEGAPMGESEVPGLLRHLGESPDWSPAYKDEQALIYLRAIPAPAKTRASSSIEKRAPEKKKR